MSEAETKPRPATTRAADKHVLAHVEKWMDLIREIGHERAAQAKCCG